MDSNALAPEDMRKRRQEAQEKVGGIWMSGGDANMGCVSNQLGQKRNPSLKLCPRQFEDPQT